VSESHWRARLLWHIERHHAQTKFKANNGALIGTGVFVASGTKQLKIIKALYDDDSLYDRMGAKYLHRSAEIICRAFVQTPASNIIKMDKSIVLVLDVTGPKYVSKEDSAMMPLLRRGSRSFYYTREFANALFNDALLLQGRMKKIRNIAVQRSVQSGNVLWHLFPTKVETWLVLAEDVFTSHRCSVLFERLEGALLHHDEYKHLTIDATLRLAMRLIGQASYRAGKEERASAVIGDAEALRRIITVRGRTGAAVGIWLAQSEDADVIAAMFTKNFSVLQLQQVTTLASDCPSPRLYRVLLAVLPNLLFLILDPVHLCINFNTAHWKKKTYAERVLRIIMHKFNKVDHTKTAAYWGMPFADGVAPDLDARQMQLRTWILNGRMPRLDSETYIRNINPEAPWYSVTEFIKSLAALCSVYWVDVDRTTNINQKPLYHVIWCAAAPDRIQYYFNNIRFRHSVPKSMLALLSSGTSSNESLHAELNTAMRNQPSALYSTTLILCLRIFSFLKMLAHNLLLYSPQLRKHSQQTILAASASNRPFDMKAWEEWCTPMYVDMALPQPPRLPELAARRKGFAKRIRAAKTAVMRYRINGKQQVSAILPYKAASKKRPAGVIPALSVKHIKRSVGNLKRCK
jgi:hypothetical protein